MEDFLKASGELEITLKDEFGNIKESRKVPNLVVTVGKTFIASRMVGTSATTMSHMAIGTSNTSPASADTTLGAEVARVTLSAATSANNVVSYSATFAAGTGTGAIVEAGVLNAGTVGTLLCRTTFAVINKGVNDTLTINWNVTIN